MDKSARPVFALKCVQTKQMSLKLFLSNLNKTLEGEEGKKCKKTAQIHRKGAERDPEMSSKPSASAKKKKKSPVSGQTNIPKCPR